MNDDLVEIACIVDRSGSMAAITSDAIGGFNAFLTGQKKEPGDAVFTLVLFDHEYTIVHDGADINNVDELTPETYQPRGSTALLDAIGRTIDAIGRRLSETPEEKRPHKVIVAILTDGMENASSDYTHEKVSEMIDRQRSVYKWDFVFLAANQDAISSARALSISPENAFKFAATGEGVQEAFSSMNMAVASRRRAGADPLWSPRPSKEEGSKPNP